MTQPKTNSANEEHKCYQDGSVMEQCVMNDINKAVKLLIKNNAEGVIFRIPIVGNDTFKVTIERVRP
jgi:hypothetical protein